MMKILERIYCFLFKIFKRDNLVKTVLLLIELLLSFIILRLLIKFFFDVDLLFDSDYKIFTLVSIFVITLVLGLTNHFYFSKIRIEDLLNERDIA